MFARLFHSVNFRLFQIIKIQYLNIKCIFILFIVLNFHNLLKTFWAVKLLIFYLWNVSKFLLSIFNSFVFYIISFNFNFNSFVRCFKALQILFTLYKVNLQVLILFSFQKLHSSYFLFSWTQTISSKMCQKYPILSNILPIIGQHYVHYRWDKYHKCKTKF